MRGTTDSSKQPLSYALQIPRCIFGARLRVRWLFYKVEWETLHRRIDKQLRTRNPLVHVALYVEPQKEREHEKISSRI
jgi:hypothetical protein